MKPFYRKGMKLPLTHTLGDITNPNDRSHISNHEGILVTILRASKFGHNRWALKMQWEGYPNLLVEYWLVDGSHLLGWTAHLRNYLPFSQNNIGCVQLNPGEANKLLALAKQEGLIK